MSESDKLLLTPTHTQFDFKDPLIKLQLFHELRMPGVLAGQANKIQQMTNNDKHHFMDFWRLGPFFAVNLGLGRQPMRS